MLEAESESVPSPLFSKSTNRRHMLRGGLTATMLAGAGFPLRATAQTVTPTANNPVSAEELSAFIADAMTRYDVPGVAVSLVQHGETLLEQGFGVRELGKPGAIDANTQFQLASNSKPMTAAALGVLVDDGSLSFDDRVTDILDNFQLEDPYPTRYCTIRDLLAHRSGFPEFYGDILGRLGYDRHDIVRRLRFVETAGRFREHALYSNLGYFTAGEVLATATGLTWEAAMSDLLWSPLAMTRTNSMAAGYPADGNYARNHALVDGQNTAIDWDDSVTFGAAGGVISTAHDMGTWMKMLLAQEMTSEAALLSPETRADLFAESMVADISFSEMAPIGPATGFAYGLGWGVFRMNGHVVLEKGGALGGIRTVVNLVPDLGLGIAVLANQNLTAIPEAIRAFVLESYLGQTAADTQDQIFASWQQLMALFASAAEPVTAVDPALPLDAYAGFYTNDLCGDVEILAVGENLLRLEAGPARTPASMTPVGHDVFQLVFPSYTSFGEVVTFMVDEYGAPTGFATESMGKFRRVI